jgi:hypothetical protein
MRDWNDPEPPLESMYTLPALGLEELERDRFGFHVVNADASAGLDLSEAFGAANTLLVNGDFFRPEHIIHQLDVFSKGGQEPVRVVFRNLSGIQHNDVLRVREVLRSKIKLPD